MLSYVPEHLKALPWSAAFLGLAAHEQEQALAELDADLAEFRTDYGMSADRSEHSLPSEVSLVVGCCKKSRALRLVSRGGEVPLLHHIRNESDG